MDVNEPKMENHLDRLTDERLPRGKRNVAGPTMSPDVYCVKSGKTHLKILVFISFSRQNIKLLRHALKIKRQGQCERTGTVTVWQHFLTCCLSVNTN